jgi:hypothetical protein
MQSGPFSRRPLRVRYWNAEARIVDAERMTLESHLRRLGDVTVEAATTLEDAYSATPDLIIIAAPRMAETDFPAWLTGTRKRMQAQNGIWTPVVVLADVGFGVLADQLLAATADNWYVDVVSPAHVSSLPIRIANLLRIHDHLHELFRYASAVSDVGIKVQRLEAELERLRGAKPQ